MTISIAFKNDPSNPDLFITVRSAVSGCLNIDPSTGIGTYSQTISSIQLSQIPKGITVPYGDSCRIYFSGVSYQQMFNQSGGQGTVPIGWQPPDSYQNTPWDIVEYTFSSKGIWMDCTGVNSYCIPLEFELISNSGSKIGGYAGNKTALWAEAKNLLAACKGTDWTQLIQGSGPNARIMSPDTAWAEGGKFDLTFLSDYINNTFIPTFRENKITLQTDKGVVYSGQIDANNVLQLGTLSMPLPTTADNIAAWFAPGLKGGFSYPGDPQAATKNNLARNLTAAVAAGIPVDIIKANTLNYDFFQTATLYQAPTYDGYIQAMHQLLKNHNSTQYFYAYDDLLNQSGTQSQAWDPSLTISISVGNIISNA